MGRKRTMKLLSMAAAQDAIVAAKYDMTIPINSEYSSNIEITTTTKVNKAMKTIVVIRNFLDSVKTLR